MHKTLILLNFQMNKLFSMTFLDIRQTLHLQCNKDYPQYV